VAAAQPSTYGAQAGGQTDGEPRPEPPHVVSLNTATAQELDSLPGIGPVYAASIVAYRERKLTANGCGFESVDELLNVPGIGPKRFEAIQHLVIP
jgi:competence protein ComEA